jgi:DNA-binding NarL/FixJ family response regulator
MPEAFPDRGAACKALDPQRVYKIFIVDDHPIIRQEIRSIISAAPDMELLGEASSAEETLESLKEYRPDLVVTDISMKEMDGLELLERIHALWPGLPVTIMSMHDKVFYGPRVLELGARGYIDKREFAERGADTIRCHLARERCSFCPNAWTKKMEISDA